METEVLKYRKVSELCPLKNNPRKIDKKGLDRLVDSIHLNGFWEHQPIALEEQDGKLVVLSGNQRLKAAKRLGLKEVPTVLYSGLTEEERQDIVLRSNINNGEWDFGLLKTDFEADFDFLGIDIKVPADEVSVSGKKESEEDGADAEKESFYRQMSGDFLYESDNVFDIPNLLLEQQPLHVELPLSPWGANSRLRKDVATYHFYVDDYRFEALFKDPVKLLRSGCKNIVEPNCSCHDQTPVSMGLYQIYRKRYLARYFQECGIKVWADLNVSHKFRDYNRLGIPKGYNAFFTRGLDGWTESLKLDLEVAQEISGKEHPNLCVYGGGANVQAFCRENSLLYVTDFINAKKKIREDKQEGTTTTQRPGPRR